MSEQNTVKFNKDSMLNSAAAVLFIVGLICVGYVLFSRIEKQRQIAKIGNLDCAKNHFSHVVKDEHMAGILQIDSSVRIYENFYFCNDVRRDDLVYFRFSQEIPPVVRVVRGIPGDKYSLREDSQNKGYWNIFINEVKLKIGNQAYFIKSAHVPVLRTYELSRNGVLAEEEYILLSGTPPGLSDSSNFGIIKKKDLVGKVLME